VDLQLSDDQELFRETTERFIDARFPLTRVRELSDTPVAHDPALLGEAGELGWFALFVPEEHGGGTVSGSAVRDAVIVAEERGRFVQPGPFVGTNVATFALARDGSTEQQSAHLPALASGERTASWAFTGRSGVPEVGAVRASRSDGGESGDGYILDGTASLVPEGPSADVFVVSAGDVAGGAGGVTQFVVDATAPGVTVTQLGGLDLTRRFADVHFDGTSVPASAVVGTPGHAQASVDAQLDLAVALTLAESVGAMRQLAEITVEYSKARIAFGRPIGSFQALKHILADVSFWAEVSLAAAGAAAEAVADARPTASEIVSIAKAYVGEAGTQLAQQCLQVHGGIGFTWEHDLHFYLRRLSADRVLYGDPEWHRERICRIHGL